MTTRRPIRALTTAALLAALALHTFAARAQSTGEMAPVAPADPPPTTTIVAQPGSPTVTIVFHGPPPVVAQQPPQGPIAPVAPAAPMVVPVEQPPIMLPPPPPAAEPGANPEGAASLPPMAVMPGMLEASDVITAARLERTFAYYGQTARTRRTIFGIMDLTLSVGIGITGAWMLSQNISGFEPAGWVVLGSGIALGLGGILALAMPSEMERLHAEYLGWLHSGLSPAEAVRRAEARWQTLADRARSMRQVSAGIAFAGLGVGVAGLLLTALAMPGRAVDRLPLEIAFGGEALLFGGIGVSSLVLESETEAQLRVWRISQGRETRTSSFRLTPPSIAVLPNGASVGIGGVF